MAKAKRDSGQAAVEQAIAQGSAELFRRLVEALAAQGVASTRAAVADLLDVRPATIAAWASGRATPTIDRVVKLARLSGIDLTRLLAVPVAPWLDVEADELLQLFRRASPEGRRFVLEAARLAAKPAARRARSPRRR